MADLEDLGLLTHTHTSSGRIPTDFGYRVYVDSLTECEDLAPELRDTIQSSLQSGSAEVLDILDEVSELLGEVSRLLSVITKPDLSSGILQKVELIRVASDRIMVIIVVSSGLVNTITLEIKSAISNDEITAAGRFINERLTGLRLADIPLSINRRLGGDRRSSNAIVRMFLDFPDLIFLRQSRAELRISGARRALEQPEYQTPEKFKGIIELVEDRDIIVHLLRDRSPGVRVTIGREHSGEQLKDFSVITSTYRIGNTQGTLGIIGPTRMDYSRLISLVDYTSRLVSERISQD